VATHYRERSSFVVGRLNEIGKKYLGGDIAKEPQGTFYVFCDFSKLQQIDTDLDLQIFLRDRYKTEGTGVAGFTAICCST